MHLPAELRGKPFTTQQAHDAGVSRYALRQLAKDRLVRRVLRSVYAETSLPDTWSTRLDALKLVTRGHVIICDRTAAWLHGVDTFEFRELEILPKIETCVLPDRTRVRRAQCLGRSRDLLPEDIEPAGNLWVTTPLRTALDLGCLLGRRDALAALDGYLRQWGLRVEQLKAELPRYRRRRGVVQLRELLALADARAESPGESWTRLCIIDAGLPMPELQYWVTEGGRQKFRLDLAYPRHRVAIEYDGQEFHGLDEQRWADESRRQWLRERGWTVIVVGKDDFSSESIDRWTNDVRTALRLAA